MAERKTYFDKTEESVRFDESGKQVFFKKCGHTHSEKFTLTFWDLEIDGLNPELMKKKLFSGKKVFDGSCPQCMLAMLKKHAIRCCLCGGAITPGDGVASYHKDNPINHEAATFVGDYALGCLRMGCCPSGAFFSGHWTEEGFKPLFPEGLTAGQMVMATGGTVFVNVNEGKAEVRPVDRKKKK